MDQTTPSYSGTGLEGSTFGGPDRDNFDYFPYGESYSEVDFYNVPNQVNQLSFAHHVNQPSINIPPRIFPESPPGSFPMRFVAQSGIQGSPSYSSSSGTPPSLSFQAHKPQHLLHAPYDISASAIKRFRGVSATYSDHSSSPSSLLSCKQEDELGFVPFPQNEGGAQFLPGQFYQESSALSVFDDGHRTIEFKPIFQDQCCVAVDSSGRPTIFTDFKVQADKGFNHSQLDDAFICQKKNHFQVTHQVSILGVPDFVQITPGTSGPTYHKINGYYIELFGVKTEAQQLSNKIKIEQSQSDRSRKEFPPHYVAPANLQKQIIIGRLHFSETTSNNMRKKGKPNPDQRFFRLVVGLFADCTNQQTGQSFRQLMCASGSENIIVRASNPGQFESDAQPGPAWQRGTQDEDAIFHVGRIGINTEKPTEALDVRGNINVSGRINQPSDARAKDILGEVDNMQQLENIRNLTLYRYKYKDEVCKTLQLNGTAQYDTGILAQDLLDTIPEAVEFVGDLELENGETIENFLMVNKDRLFMEGVGAVQALCSVTDNLGNTIVTIEDRLNKIRRVLKLRRGDSLRSNISSVTGKSIYSCATTAFVSPSARPSVYSISSIPFKEKDVEEKSNSLKKFPATFLERHQLLQWFILAFVTIVSFSLIALLAVYTVTKERKTYFEPTLPTVIVERSLSTTTPSSVLHSSSSSEMTRINPYVMIGDHGAWLSHFTADICNASPLIASNKVCLSNETSAQVNCRIWPYLQCCSDKLSRPILRSLPVPEAAHFPEYQAGNQYNYIKRNLKISFDATKDNTRKDYTMDSENLVGKEMSDGQAIVYTMPVDSEVVKDLLEPMPQGNCDHSIRNHNFSDEDHEQRWGPLMHKIRLVEPDITLDRDYCFSVNRSEKCGYGNTFVITLPLSKYYAEANMTVLFEAEPATSLVTCGYRILGDGCYHRLSTAYHQEVHDNIHAFTVPVGNHAHSELTVAICPASSFKQLNTDICEHRSPDIFTFRLLFGRTCS